MKGRGAVCWLFSGQNAAGKGSQLRPNLCLIFFPYSCTSLHFPLIPSLLISPLPASSAPFRPSAFTSLLFNFLSFSSHILSHCHLVLTPSPQSLHPSSSSRDEVQLFNGVLPLAGESHPSSIGVASSTRPAVGVPATLHAHPRHGNRAAVVVVAWRRVGVHLDHVVAVHGRRDTDVLLRLGLLVMAKPAHCGHHPNSWSSVAPSNNQTHRNQPVLQTVRGHKKPLVGPGTRIVYTDDVLVYNEMDIPILLWKQQFNIVINLFLV